MLLLLLLLLLLCCCWWYGWQGLCMLLLLHTVLLIIITVIVVVVRRTLCQHGLIIWELRPAANTTSNVATPHITRLTTSSSTVATIVIFRRRQVRAFIRARRKPRGRRLRRLRGPRPRGDGRRLSDTQRACPHCSAADVYGSHCHGATASSGGRRRRRRIDVRAPECQ
jgi:hypothetical protein